ncbi:hypothetical protein ACFX13_043849 [Malus domestica]
MIAHSGHSVIKQFRFGETAMSHTKTRMEEAWIAEEVAFKVRGLSMDCFIPPAELRFVTKRSECLLNHNTLLNMESKAVHSGFVVIVITLLITAGHAVAQEDRCFQDCHIVVLVIWIWLHQMDAMNNASKGVQFYLPCLQLL